MKHLWDAIAAEFVRPPRILRAQLRRRPRGHPHPDPLAADRCSGAMDQMTASADPCLAEYEG